MILCTIERGLGCDAATSTIGVNQELEPGTKLMSQSTGEVFRVIGKREATPEEITEYEREANMTEAERDERERRFQEGCEYIDRMERASMQERGTL